MDSFGLNLGFLASSIVSLVIFLGWLVLAVLALLALRNRKLPTASTAIWALIIIGVPVLGAVAFLIVKPS